MTDLERVAVILKSNRMAKEHEDYGFPRGWNEALDFVGREIEKLKGEQDGEAGFVARDG